MPYYRLTSHLHIARAIEGLGQRGRMASAFQNNQGFDISSRLPGPSPSRPCSPACPHYDRLSRGNRLSTGLPFRVRRPGDDEMTMRIAFALPQGMANGQRGVGQQHLEPGVPQGFTGNTGLIHPTQAGNFCTPRRPRSGRSALQPGLGLPSGNWPGGHHP